VIHAHQAVLVNAKSLAALTIDPRPFSQFVQIIAMVVPINSILRYEVKSANV